jgi:class 3 adenylate cyclase
MKRKIAAILAADVVGYSKLVAEDEEETLRRLASYRGVFDDFIARGSGRIFNTAGDAILAEFPSAVEAVRCAIDVQESLRTRNLAYPASRQMMFRIGITVGDVVERDGDLLGDGVNIAARLEGLAQPGGLCVSRTVYEQVANKLSVEFADIGEQEVKNIPSPVHAYTLALGRVEGGIQVPGPKRKATKAAVSSWAVAVIAAGIGALAVLAVVYVTLMRPREAQPPNIPGSAGATNEQKTSTPPPPVQQAEAIVPEAIPFISDRERASIRADYLPAQDHKALAINFFRAGFITGQKDDESAKAVALANCHQPNDPNTLSMRCVGNTVVYNRGHPPMPAEPWVVRDPTIERPFASADVPLANDAARTNLEKVYPKGPAPKAMALSSRGGTFYFFGQSNSQEAIRRALEGCGSASGVPCLIIAVDDAFVVPIPTTMKAVGFFRAAGSPALAPEVRDDVARRLANDTTGWKAVAAGASGRPGLALNAASEQAAIDAALADCARQDRNCRVVAIGPFAIEPN